MKFILILIAVMLTGCGGGSASDDLPNNKALSVVEYAWDGTFNPESQLVGTTFSQHFRIDWNCRDTTSGQLVEKVKCANRPVGDYTWPTQGIPTDTGLWYRGVEIETICRDSIDRFIASRAGYSFHYQPTIEVPYLNGLMYNFPAALPSDAYYTHWPQMDGIWSLMVKFDNQNWAVFVIRAPGSAIFHDAACRAFVREGIVYKGYTSI